MNLTIDNTRLRELIPNIIHEVKGETPLVDKLAPWLQFASRWISDNFLGSFDLPDSLTPLAEKIVVFLAFAQAVPSLDVTLSPAGFAVIDTDGRAPASKERIQRLIESLNSFVDANSDTLLSLLSGIPEWRTSPVGKYWCSSFIPSLSYAYRFRKQMPLLDTYRSIRIVADGFEKELAEQYLGFNTLAFLQSQQFVPEAPESEVIEMIRNAEIAFIAFSLNPDTSLTNAPHAVWHAIRPVLSRLKSVPSLYQRWYAEMGQSFSVPQFKNNIKGAFYF